MSFINAFSIFPLAVASPGLDQVSLPHLFRFILLFTLLFTTHMLVLDPLPLLNYTI